MNTTEPTPGYADTSSLGGTRWTAHDGRALDECRVCSVPMCEEVDYVEEAMIVATEDHSPAPDPCMIVTCEDCAYDSLSDMWEDEGW